MQANLTIPDTAQQVADDLGDAITHLEAIVLHADPEDAVSITASNALKSLRHGNTQTARTVISGLLSSLSELERRNPPAVCLRKAGEALEFLERENNQ